MSRTSLKELKTDLVGQLCKKCGTGKLEAKFTNVRVDRVFHRAQVEGQRIKMTIEIQNVPALICDYCGRELIPIHVEKRLWEILNETITSDRLQAYLEKAYEVEQETHRMRVRRSEVETTYEEGPLAVSPA